MQILFSRDGSQELLVDEWFRQSFNYVNLSEHMPAFWQALSKGNGKNLPFPGEYNYKQDVAFEYYANFKRIPAEIRELKYLEWTKENDVETYCNMSSAVYAHNAGRKDVAKILVNVPAMVDKMAALKKLDGVVELDNPPVHFDRNLYLAFNSTHVAPLANWGQDGELYIPNIGDWGRHGMVHIEYGFGDKIPNMRFFRIIV